MRSPRKDRGGSASDRSGLGAVRRQTRPRGCRSLEQDGPGAAVRFDVGGTLRGGRAGLRNRSADFGGAMRSADLWAARRSERPWREPPAYAGRIGRSANTGSGDSGGGRIPVHLCACMDACDADSGMGRGSLGRALNLSGDMRGRLGGALCRGWMTSTGCRSM